MDQSKLKKPAHLGDETWQQHLEWMSVMGKQVEENFARHCSRVEEDANRNRALRQRHEQVLQAERRIRSLFSMQLRP